MFIARFVRLMARDRRDNRDLIAFPRPLFVDDLRLPRAMAPDCAVVVEFLPPRGGGGGCWFVPRGDSLALLTPFHFFRSRPQFCPPFTGFQRSLPGEIPLHSSCGLRDAKNGCQEGFRGNSKTYPSARQRRRVTSTLKFRVGEGTVPRVQSVPSAMVSLGNLSLGLAGRVWKLPCIVLPRRSVSVDCARRIDCWQIFGELIFDDGRGMEDCDV